MLNKLVTIGVLVSALTWGQNTSKHQETQPSTAKEHASKAGYPAPPPDTVTNPPNPAPRSTPIFTDEHQQSPPKSVYWFLQPEWVIVWVTVAYTIITGFTLSAIKRQANLMEAQANDARVSAQEATAVARTTADAALLNAQAVINAERALLLFKIDKASAEGRPGHAEFLIFIHNYGRLPARKISIFNPTNTLTMLEELRQYFDVEEFPAETEEWLAPGERRLVYTFRPFDNLESAFVEAAKRAKTNRADIHNVIFGEVTYSDGISTELRHSRYCLAHFGGGFYEIGGFVQSVGCGKYTECT